MRKIFFILLILSANTAFALTMNEALTTGYNSDSFKIIRSDFLTEIERFPQALSGFMPKISAEFDTSNVKNSQKSTLVDLNVYKSRSQSSALVVEQSLFNGGSSVAELKAAQAYFRAARGDYYSKEQSILLEQITTYLNCVETRKKYEITQVSVSSNRTQLTAMQEKLKYGEGTETEVASARSGLATAEANQATAYANFEESKARFQQIFGIEPVNIDMPQAPDNLPDSLEQLIQYVDKFNPELEKIKHTTNGTKADEWRAKAALLPRVSLSFQNNRTTYNPEDAATLQINNRGLTSTLSVRVPILSRGGAEYSDIRKAKLQTRRNAISLEAKLKQLRADSKASWEAMNAARLRINASSEGLRAAEIAYEGIVQEEKLGSKTVLDVLTMEDRLNKAKELKIEADKELILASYRIKSLMGELTAVKLKLPVAYFSPEAEFKKVKIKIIGS